MARRRWKIRWNVRWNVSWSVAVAAVAALVMVATPAIACDTDEPVLQNPGPNLGQSPGQSLGAADAASARVVRAGVRQVAAAQSAATKNVDVLGNLPETAGAISINFLEYGLRHGQSRDVMVVSGTFGLKLYDLSANPAAPALLGQFDLPGIWETEDTELDPVRKLVFLARDPRAFGGDVRTGASGIYTVDVADPSRPRLLSFVSVPAGHTTSCIDGCRFLWTGGPATAATMPATWGGRPIWVTDMRDPRHPVVSPFPIDLGRNDGKTDYAHDVQVDARGIAWSSGRGGVRGYWTSGRHYDPLERRVRRATAWDPVPYAGGGIAEDTAPSRFMHNSFRPVGSTRDAGADARRWGDGQLIYATEEAFNTDCATDGALVIASLRGSHDGQAWRSTPEQPFRLTTVGSFRVAGQEGTDPAQESCSAHYFTMRDGVVVQSFYEQGVRFIDVRDPVHPTQVAYYRAADAVAWASYWHRNLVYVADNSRGVDIIRPNLGQHGSRSGTS